MQSIYYDYNAGLHEHGTRLKQICRQSSQFSNQ